MAVFIRISICLAVAVYLAVANANGVVPSTTARQKISLNAGWKFSRFVENPDGIIYDWRADVNNTKDIQVLKPWILPSGNDFIGDAAKRHPYPPEQPKVKPAFIQSTFDDSAWGSVDLPHDWAIQGPYEHNSTNDVYGFTGRLPVHGIGWYRRKIDFSKSDKQRCIYIDIEGAMSYTMVWLNGNLVGGWPFGYNSFRLDLTPYLRVGENSLAIRIDNPANGSRWYNGGGIYRDVWLVKVDPIHVGQFGTTITTRDVAGSRTVSVDVAVKIENTQKESHKVDVTTEIFELVGQSARVGRKVGEVSMKDTVLEAGRLTAVAGSMTLQDPKRWGPMPNQTADRYVAVTRLYSKGRLLDEYETRFGVRSVEYTSDRGLLINGQRTAVQGVNLHHDHGALGAAFNLRAAERQLEMLKEMGVNAIRMAHNPPAPALLDLTDRMGFLVVDEIFDAWTTPKTANDFHLIFSDWHEQDLRSMLRRDRNHPSIIAWSFGNEVAEQTDELAGPAMARRLRDIVRQEDPTRLSTASMHVAGPNSNFSREMDIISLNYQGAGACAAPDIACDTKDDIPSTYPGFHAQHPGKLIWSTETSAACSTRGTYLFPVVNATSGVIPLILSNDSNNNNNNSSFTSAYELYAMAFGASADKTFRSQDAHPFVAGEFVWSGFDYLGEPFPFPLSARSSYFGAIDLAGFKKDRFWLYQSRWRADLKSAHILPHWTWPERVGQVTPVHVFSAADEAELFLNGRSLGKHTRAAGGLNGYRFRWDDVVYEPGEIRVVTHKQGARWASASRRTAGQAAGLRLTADRSRIASDGLDLAFVTVEVVDGNGEVVPGAEDVIEFTSHGDAGRIVATDNGNPLDEMPFPRTERKAFGGLALAIVRGSPNRPGKVIVRATAAGLRGGSAVIEVK